ncbi:hypothetical protein HAQ01_13790 [Acidithiobacillus thiooxidans]|uniref:hypothetical protein n=1 Tax=Acidithiobacillus thiooxidans TaxID=930 RepID=UPI001C07A63F|nr:hypothetical protein [Acidithiobacillus thiooxidans]MBU2794428.1 hypothetical protein [Acidithiobacillus thiooxidans]
MHPNDLFVAKLLANQPKDREFLAAMIACDLVRRETILHGLPHVPGITEQELEAAQNRVSVLFESVANDFNETDALPNEAAELEPDDAATKRIITRPEHP